MSLISVVDRPLQVHANKPHNLELVTRVLEWDYMVFTLGALRYAVPQYCRRPQCARLDHTFTVAFDV